MFNLGRQVQPERSGVPLRKDFGRRHQVGQRSRHSRRRSQGSTLSKLNFQYFML